MILNGVIFKSFFVQRKSNFIKDFIALIPDNTRLLVLCQWSVAQSVASKMEVRKVCDSNLGAGHKGQ